MGEIDHFVGVDFSRFKAFRNFSIELRSFNILVGPNNAGKSTVLAAFRILASAIRRAEARKAELLAGPNGLTYGHKIDLRSISVAEENIFFNYNDDEAATVTFRISNQNRLILYFPEREVCYFIPDAQGKSCNSPSSFKSNFKCSIGFVPILGPVDHNERLYEREAARLALFNYRAARNFRNIWYHFPEKFDEFRELVKKTWPGHDVEPPEIDNSHSNALLFMYCPEKRIPREIFWSGFGFQVWCQMLTHIIQWKHVSLFLIDEPDIYLHSDLQRQLLGILRDLGPDILIATHSTEIITEADSDEIVVVDKGKSRARRIKSASQLNSVFRSLGSRLNPILTQLAKTRRVIFVEGNDFQILGRLARKLGSRVGLGSDFAIVSVEGFNPERIRSLKAGMEATLGSPIAAAAILDRDYRPAAECEEIVKSCQSFCDFVEIHNCKEIENFLLVPDAIDRAVQTRLNDRERRTGKAVKSAVAALDGLIEFSEENRVYVTGQLVSLRRRYEKSINPNLPEETIIQRAISEFEKRWESINERLKMIPGKDALSFLNDRFQVDLQVNITATSVIEAMRVSEIPDEFIHLIASLDKFILSTETCSDPA